MNKTKRIQYISAVTVMSASAVFGYQAIMGSLAATPPLLVEPETGIVAAPATVIADTAASGGKALNFGSANSFVHPGIDIDRRQLDLVKANVQAGKQPWRGAYDKMAASKYASLSYVPHPVDYVECGNGSYTTTVTKGCVAERSDAKAAYTHALLWYISGSQTHAAKAKEIMNAWSGTLIDHRWDGTSRYGNNKLQAGWAGTNFLRAAEIIRYSDVGWSATDIGRFETMMTKAYLPHTIDGWTGGAFNWMTLLADTTMKIGIFTNNRAVFDNGIGDWRRHVSAHIYLTSDGSTPKIPAELTGVGSSVTTYWRTSTFNNGQTQETCRDLGHTAMGLASAIDAAETARLQGIDLYGEQQSRLTAALEFQARNVRHREAKDSSITYVIPSAICDGTLNWGGAAAKLTGEVALSHYSGRQQLPLPEHEIFVKKYRPMPYGSHDLHMQWETLTHVIPATAGL